MSRILSVLCALRILHKTLLIGTKDCHGPTYDTATLPLDYTILDNDVGWE